MFEVVPWPTPTSATTDATPMMTPSIVSAARSRLVRRRESASRSSSKSAHATTRPSRRWIWRVGRGGDLGVVGDEDDRPAGVVELVEQRHDLGAGMAVEVAGRLVGQDQRGFGDDRPGDGDALLLAAGQLGRLVVEAVAEPEPLERRAGRAPARFDRETRPGRGAASRRCRAPSSAAAGCTTGRRTRWSGCGRAARLVVVEVGDRRAGEAVLPGRRAVQAAEDVHHRGLARAGRPDDREELPGMHLEADVGEGRHLHVPHLVGPADAVERDDRLGHRSVPVSNTDRRCRRAGRRSRPAPDRRRGWPRPPNPPVALSFPVCAVGGRRSPPPGPRPGRS